MPEENTEIKAALIFCLSLLQVIAGNEFEVSADVKTEIEKVLTHKEQLIKLNAELNS